MINKITGIIEEIIDNSLSVCNNDISYTIYISGGMCEYLKRNSNIGEKISIYTIYYIENGIGGSSLNPKLIGFHSPIEREFFEKYITVKGLGIKNALKSLVISVKNIATAIENGNVEKIKKLPGIGKRTAEKIVAELKGRVAKYALVKEDLDELKSDESVKNVNIELEISEQIEEEVNLILSDLGYSKSEIKTMLRIVYAQKKDYSNTEEVIQEIFKLQKK
jgi:Holliday junction DNA helicase RuvA